MFTLIPSLYIVAVHYFRHWNLPYFSENNEEEDILSNNNVHINDNHLTQSLNDKKPIEFDNKYENTLLQINTDELINNFQQSIHSALYDKSGYIIKTANDEDDKFDKNKLSTKQTNQSSSLLNIDRRKTYSDGLSEDDVLYLINETGFSREQILLWHSDFLRDCPDGRLSKSKFIDIYKQFYKKGQVAKFCEHAFRVFDKDGSGYIDFVEFLIAVSMTSTRDPVRKTELFFSMYDIDQNGLIDENEMRCVVESIYELMGIDTQDSSRIDMKVQEIFAKAECDQTGYLRKDQFALACKNDRYIRKLLVPNTKAPNNR